MKKGYQYLQDTEFFRSTAPLVVLTQLRASELRHMCYLFEVSVKSARQRETPNVAARGTTQCTFF